VIATASLWSVSAQSRVVSEDQARRVLDAIYKGDYQRAFRERKPELFLKHIPDDFKSVSVEGGDARPGWPRPSRR
jgi:hypothetical protein